MKITNPPTRITDELWMLGTAQYPLYCFQNGAESLVFEGGTGAMGPLLSEQMAAAGIDVGSVKQLVVTHGHPDHVMAVPGLRKQLPSVEVLASAIAANTLLAEKAIVFFGKVDHALTESLLVAGAITEAHRPAPLAESTIAIDRVIKEGDVISVGEASFRVLETPGHSDCSLSFFEADRGILVISDVTGYYLPAQDSWWPNYFTGYGSYLESIKRVAGLNAEVLCLSHNAAITGSEEIGSYFEGAIAATEAYHRRIVDAINGGTSAEALAEQLAGEIHEKVGLLPPVFFQKNCALLIKQSLKHEDKTAEE